jgi:hypothetical protein
MKSRGRTEQELWLAARSRQPMRVAKFRGEQFAKLLVTLFPNFRLASIYSARTRHLGAYRGYRINSDNQRIALGIDVRHDYAWHGLDRLRPGDRVSLTCRLVYGPAEKAPPHGPSAESFTKIDTSAAPSQLSLPCNSKNTRDSVRSSSLNLGRHRRLERRRPPRGWSVCIRRSEPRSL